MFVIYNRPRCEPKSKMDLPQLLIHHIYECICNLVGNSKFSFNGGFFAF
jgi:hypothetical protein